MDEFNYAVATRRIRQRKLCLDAAKPNLEDVGGKPMTSRQPDEGVTRKRRREAASCTRNARVRQGLAGALRLRRTPSLIEGLLTLKRKREDEKNAANEDRAEGNQFF